MKRRMRAAVVPMCLLLVAVLVCLMGMEVLAQIKERKKPKVQLPDYYSRVVTEKQREQLYAIADKYDAEIEKLQVQLKDLRARREAEMSAVLTDDQKQRIKQIQDEERAQQEANKKAKESAAKRKAKEKE